LRPRGNFKDGFCVAKSQSKQRRSKVSHDIPVRRWTVLAQDPAFTDAKGYALTTTIEVPAERLDPGPCGHRVRVVDFDATANVYFGAASRSPEKDRYKKPRLMAGLLRDPHFHQQNVYAIAMGTLFQFEQALGRAVDWGFGRANHQLKIAPHAFAEDNAYYSRETESLSFGYYQEAGRQVFTCLSHDIVVHETTHALLDGIRPHYLKPSSEDQAGFHEGFADIVALLSVFRHNAIVEHALKPLENPQGRLARGRLTLAGLADTALLKLGEEMGGSQQGARGKALRESLKIKPDPSLYGGERYREEHDRGELLVAMVLRAFVGIWVRRLALLLPPVGGSLARSVVAEEGSTAAKQLLHLCIRALDYLPPVDMTFRDYLSALLTADRELFPDDGKYGFRRALRESFAAFGVRPASTKDKEGCWDSPEASEFKLSGVRLARLQRDPATAFRFIWENRTALKLDKEAYTQVTGVQPVVRVGRDGMLLTETVVEYVQTLKVWSDELKQLGIGKPSEMKSRRLITLYGGGSLIFDEYGRLKYRITSGVRSNKQTKRLKALWKGGYFAQESAPSSQSRIASLHRRRELKPLPVPQEDWT
jgi:hypothetical protein